MKGAKSREPTDRDGHRDQGLTQIRHDPRTIVLLLAVPVLLLVLMKFIFDGQEQAFQAIGAPLCGLFPFIVMFLVSSITMLRERTTGTLERLMMLPMLRPDLLAGYRLAFGLIAATQAVQFMPAFIFPQSLLCGLFVGRSGMAPALEAFSWLLSFIYAYHALARVTSPEPLNGAIVADVAVVVATAVVALALGALTLKRRTP